MSPNGVWRASPPANASPPSRKWQEIQSPAATRYWPRRPCAALGAESSKLWESSPRGVTAELGCAGNGSIWLTAKPATLKTARDPLSNANRNVLGRRMALPSHQRSGRLEVLRLDRVGRHVGERCQGGRGVVARVLRKRPGTHGENIGHIPGLQIFIDHAVLGVVPHDGAARVVRGLVGRDAPGTGASIQLDLARIPRLRHFSVAVR